MTEGQTETVEAVANVGTEPVPGTLAGGEPAESIDVSLVCQVEARLEGPDFEISPEDWTARSFLRTNVITWRWQVKPETSGKALPLSLRLRAFVDVPNGGEALPLNLFDPKSPDLEIPVCDVGLFRSSSVVGTMEVELMIMMHGHSLRTLVVGVDGSPAAAAALDWAADTVGRDGELHAIAAVSPATELLVDAALADSLAYRGVLERELERVWTTRVRGRVGLVTAAALEGTAANALVSVAISRHADAIVVGTHTPLAPSPKPLGSTIRHLLRALPCPLIVVPSRSAGGLSGGGPVIVGIGHGDATVAAVDWAARLADDRGIPLGLIRATGEGPVFQVDGLLDVLAYYIDPSKRGEWVHEDLVEFADRAQSSTEHHIEIGVAAVPGLPASRLVDASDNAAMLVIGQHRSILTRGRHVVQPLRYALAHAHCPVAVIPVDPPAPAPER